MRRENAINANAVGQLASSDSEKSGFSDRVTSSDEVQPEAVLIVAEESVSPAEYRGILAPELRARLDAMTRDYAQILTRIDRLEALSAEDTGKRNRLRRDNAS